MKIQEAKDKVIFIINSKNEIEQTNYYDFVMESVDETTSPRGIAPRLHFREINIPGYCLEENKNVFITEEDYESLEEEEQCKYFYYDEAFVKYEIWTWGVGGNNPKFIGDEFETEEEALEYLFEKVEKYDFQNDCNRNTYFFSSEEEALGEIIERFSSDNDISLDTAKSIMRKKVVVDQLRSSRFVQEKIKHDNRPSFTKEMMIEFINSNSEMISESLKELDELKAEGNKDLWQVKANALIQKVSNNDFRVLKWKKIFELIREQVK